MGINLQGVRAAAERLLLSDTCRIIKGADRAGHGSFNSTTGQYTPPAEEVLYEGVCNVSVINSFPSVVPAGGVSFVETNYMLKIPYSAAMPAQVEDLVEITAVHDGGDLSLLNMAFIVQAPPELATLTVLRSIRMKRRESVPQ